MEGVEYNKGYGDAKEDFLNGNILTLFSVEEKSKLYRNGYLAAMDDLKNLMKKEMPPEVKQKLEDKEVQAFWPLPW